MKVPFSRPFIDSQTKEEVVKCLSKPWLTESEKVWEFEEAFVKYTGAKYAIACSSGTAALHLAYRALNLQGEPERAYEPPFLCPSFTYIATAIAGVYCGAYPDFVDIDRDTYTIDPESIIKPRALYPSLSRLAISPPRLMVVVHYGGTMADIKQLLQIAKHYDIPLVEDCAHAHGTRLDGKHAGTFGDVGCFDARTKVLTTRGKIPISNIIVGDSVFTANNKYRPVISVLKRKYYGKWYRLIYGVRSGHHTRIVATEEHPILINVDGKDIWKPIKYIDVGEYIHILSNKCKICSTSIPWHWVLCPKCNPSMLPEVREKIKQLKTKNRPYPVLHSGSKHYMEDILPYSRKLEKEGYRVVPLGPTIPDIIAIKEGKVIAIEVDNDTNPDETKYKSIRQYFDDVIWIKPERKWNSMKRNYRVDGEFIESLVLEIEQINKKPTTVYNLEVAGSPTYVASSVLVHNCFSFYPTKNMTTLEGGMVITNREDIASKVRLLKSLAVSKTPQQREETDTPVYDVTDIGYNYRMNEAEATIGLGQLRTLDASVKARREIATIYNKELVELPGVFPYPILDKQYQSFHLYSIWLSPKARMNRDKLFIKLKEDGIQTSVHYRPLHQMTVFNSLGRPPMWGDDLAITDEVYQGILSLPIFPSMTDKELDWVIKRIKHWLG